MTEVEAVVAERLAELMPPYRDAMRFAMALAVMEDGAAVKGTDRATWAAWFNTLCQSEDRMDEFHTHMQAILAYRAYRAGGEAQA